MSRGRDDAQHALAVIRGLSGWSVPAIRPVRRALQRTLKNASPQEVKAAAEVLREAGLAWVAFELIFHHAGARGSLTVREVRKLGAELSSWGEADAFGAYIAGPAWLDARIDDLEVRRWAGSENRWWRRVALVATTVLNTRSKGGRGDSRRTLDIAARMVADADDMIVKALSWSLRSLVPWDPPAVRRFLETHAGALASRVKREVQSKLRTGLKVARPASLD